MISQLVSRFNTLKNKRKIFSLTSWTNFDIIMVYYRKGGASRKGEGYDY